MVKRTSKILLAAVTGLGALVLPGSARAVTTLTLSLNVNQSTDTWQAFATIDDNGGAPTSTLGLAAIQFDVTSTGGILLGAPKASDLKLPRTNYVDADGSSIDSGGFQLFRTASQVNTQDDLFRGAQSVQYADTSTSLSGMADNIIKGFALKGTSSGRLGDNPAGVYGDPALIAQGTFSGSNGKILISSSTGEVSLLPTTLPPNGSTIQTHSPDFVVSPAGTAVPEPASLSLVGLTMVGLLSRRRRVA